MLSKFTLSLLLSIPAIIQSADQEKHWVNVKCCTKTYFKNLGIQRIPLASKESDCVEVRKNLVKTFEVSDDKVTLLLCGQNVSDHMDSLNSLKVSLNQGHDEYDLIALIDKHK